MEKRKRYLIKVTPNGLIHIPILEKYSETGGRKEIMPEDVKNICDSLGVDTKDISLEQLTLGTREEMKEHNDVLGNDITKGVKLALVHIKKIPDYYSRLKIMEAQASKPVEPKRTISE